MMQRQTAGASGPFQSIRLETHCSIPVHSCHSGSILPILCQDGIFRLYFADDIFSSCVSTYQKLS